MDKVSLVITAYNVEKFIARCIESCINQTHQNTEIIVVNDGSTDDTAKIAETYERYSNVRVLHQTNQGISEARRSGYMSASGKYIMFVDGDDWLESVAIEKLYEKAVQTQSDLVCCGWFYSNDERKEKRNEIRDLGELKGYNFLKNLLEGHISHSLCFKFIRKSFIDNRKIKFPYDIRYAEDLATSYSLAMHQPKVTFLNECLYWYCVRSGSLTSTVSKAFLDLLKAITFIKDELITHHLYEENKTAFEYLAFRHILYIKLHYIFKPPYTSEWSKQMYENWLSLGIDIRENSYFIKRLKGKALEADIVESIMGKSYEEALIIYEQLTKGVK